MVQSIMGNASSILSVFSEWAREQPHITAFDYLDEQLVTIDTISYQQLYELAGAIASNLRFNGVNTPILLVYQPGIEFIGAFLGTLMAGLIAVPVYPVRGKVHEWDKLNRIIQDSGAHFALLGGAEFDIFKQGKLKQFLNGNVKLLRHLDMVSRDSADLADSHVQAKNTAFIQYTSGSTGSPKGVSVSHQNIIHNQQLIYRSFGHHAATKILGWLPQYHDMGLIGNLMHNIYIGGSGVLMSPVAFLKNPINWLLAISEFRATTSGGPNFAYDLCVQNFREASSLDLDLSCWEIAFNGSEPVRSDTLKRFASTFSPYGFRAEAFYPCYGMAETTLMVSGVNKDEAPNIIAVSKQAYESNRIELDSNPDSNLALVSSGTLRMGTTVRIVNAETREECDSSGIGEIWIKSPSVTMGYWQNPSLTETTYNAFTKSDHGPFLRTGDLGFLYNDELYITGRLKEVLIVRGRNYYPQDIERCVTDTSDHLRKNRAACFLAEETNGDSDITLVAELNRESVRNADIGQLSLLIKNAVYEAYQLKITHVLLVRPGGVPVTSSGKIRRRECRKLWSAGQLQDKQIVFNSLKKQTQTQTGGGQAQEGEPVLSVKRVVCELLNIDLSTINCDAPLAAQGLDSITAVQLEQRLLKRGGVWCSQADLLDGASIRTIVDGSSLLDMPVENSLNRPDITALDYRERNFWFLQELEKNSYAYNLSVAFAIEPDIPGSITPDIVRNGIVTILNMHPALHTVYPSNEGEPRKQLLATIDVATQIEMISVDSISSNATTCEITKQTKWIFDLSVAPPCRFIVYHTPAGEIVLQVVAHHICADAWSIQVIVRDFLRIINRGGNILEKRHSTSPSVLPMLNSADEHYIQEQSRRFESHSGMVDLPIDRPRPSRFNPSGSYHNFVIGKKRAEELVNIARSEGVTLYTLMVAAFQVMLYKFSNQKYFVIGTPVSERNYESDRDAVGCYIEIKHLFTEVNGNQSFSSYLKIVKQEVIKLVKFKHISAQTLLDKVGKGVMRNKGMVFPNVRFSLQQEGVIPGSARFFHGYPDSFLELRDYSVHSKSVMADVVQTELGLEVVQAENALFCQFEYSSQLFDPATVAYLESCFTNLLDSLIQNTGLLVCDIKMPPRDGLVSINRGDSFQYTQTSAVDMFKSRAQEYPEEIAVRAGDEQLSYRQLDQLSDILAYRLMSNGVSLEDRVAVLFSRNPTYVVALLAVAKAGACSVFLDGSLGIQRCVEILDITEPHCLLLDNQFAGMGLYRSEVLVDIKELNAGGEKAANLPAVNVTLDTALYVLFTSGSTGRPKGVVCTHGSVINRTRWMLDVFKINHNDVVLHTTPFNFVRSEREVFFTLSAGATLCLLQDDALRNPQSYMQAIKTHGITFTASSPAHVRAMLEVDSFCLQSINSIKYWFIGADRLDKALLKEMQKVLPDVIFAYFYGSTETTSDASCLLIDKNYTDNAFSTSIGAPLYNTELYILDQDLRAIPPGGFGELYVAGAQISRGYYNDIALTRSKYVENVINPKLKLMYSTGDVARLLPNGDIIVLGRNDGQCNVNGHRVEFGEVEHALLKNPQISEAVVTTYQVTSTTYIVAYVICRAEPFDAAGIMDQLAGILPDYTRPHVILPLEKLPLTPLGKINRSLLPSPEGSLASYLKNTYKDPDNEMEVLVRDVWMSVINAAKGPQSQSIGVNDNFFYVGGSSLLSTRVINELRDTLGVELSVKDFFDNPTVKQQAAVIIEYALNLEEEMGQ